MLCQCYLRNGIVYLPTMGKVHRGHYRGVDPVSVAPLTDADNVKLAIRRTIERGSPLVPMLRRSEYPEPVLLKYAGVKSWSTFARGAVVWDIEERDGIWGIFGHRRLRGGGWERDPDQETSFPPGTPIDEVIDRMIAILQAAAKPERGPRAAPKG